MCQKGSVCGGMCSQHHWMHAVMKICIALFIFWCGVQFGELKSTVKAIYYGSGYGMMNAHVLRDQDFFYTDVPQRGGMMGRWYEADVVATTTTTAGKR